MRDRPVAVFFAGFACGLIFLSLLLWRSGSLRAKAGGAPAQSVNHPSRESQKVVERPVTEGSLTARGLIIPVQGVRAENLRDNFEQTRGTHRHEAMDIMAPRGTPVLAVDDGKVVKLFLSKRGGLTIYQFEDSNTYCYYYAHLDRYEAGLKEGTLLRKGDIIGYVGSTGDASPDAPHLHFTIFKLGPERHWWQGTAINPFPILSHSRK